MSSTPATSSFSTRLYNYTIKNSLSYEILTKICDYRDKDEHLVIYQPEETRNLTSAELKEIAPQIKLEDKQNRLLIARVSMIPLLGLAVAETTGRIALGIFSYAFSLMTFFIPPVSNRFYVLAKDLLWKLHQNTEVIGQSFVSFFTPGNFYYFNRLHGSMLCINFLSTSLLLRAKCFLLDGPLKQSIFDTKLVTILKNVAFKMTQLEIIAFGPIEWVARASLALVAFSFHLISTPIEWMIETPFLALNNRKDHNMIISRNFRFLSHCLLQSNIFLARNWGASVYNFLLARNHLTRGLLD